jgi:c-di-GMP-binding flagellar brake protein YcgR
MDKRQYPRFDFKEAVRYQMTEQEPAFGSLAEDISEGGVRIRVHEFVPLRTIVYLKIHMTNPVRVVPVKGQVVWIKEVPHSDCYEVGIHFVEESGLEPGIGEYIRSQKFEDNIG